jgi:hypothetical protein
MIHTHTMSQLKTVQEPIKLLSYNATNLSVMGASTYAANLPTITTAIPTVTAGGSIITNNTLNYIKIIPVFKSTIVSPKFKVTGWNKRVNSSGVHNGWIPQCLFEGSVVLNSTTNIDINSAADFRSPVTISKLFGDGKIYNATTINDTAFVVIDTLGCELIEVEFVTSAGTANTAQTANAANAFIGAL